MVLGVYRLLDPSESTSPDKYKNHLPFVCVSPKSDMELHSEDQLFIFTHPNVLNDIMTEFESIYTMSSTVEQTAVTNPLIHVRNTVSSIGNNATIEEATTNSSRGSTKIPFFGAMRSTTEGGGSPSINHV